MNTFKTNRTPPTEFCQRGATLIVSLVLLIVLTLIGVTAMSTSSLEEKMAGNSRDMNLAFQAAEAALKDAEEFLRTGFITAAAFDGNNPGLYPTPAAGNPPPDVYSENVWTTALTATTNLDGISAQPRYIIEYMGTVGENDINVINKATSGNTTEVFRITARGTGGSSNAVVHLQSYYAR